MKKLKILFHTRNDSRYIVPASYYFMKELSKITTLYVSHRSGHINQILEQCDFEPDFIYFNDYLENGSPVVTGLKNLTIPFAVGLHDLHYNQDYRKIVIAQEGIQHIFTYYRDKFFQWYPEFSDRMHWLPHHANTEIFYDYKLRKDYDLLMMGATYEIFYPLRVIMKNRLKDRKEFVYHPHPGYRTIKEGEENVFVGTSYAKELNRAKICLTCDSIYKYPLMKYFEITACNSLLLAPYSNELADLGFVPGVNFVAIDEYNFEEKAYYYLKNEDERKMIAANGMRLTHEKHSTSRRVEQFLEEIEKILSS